MAPPTDPFPPVIDAISAVLAEPQPPYDTGAATPPNPALAASVTGLVNVLYGVSADAKSVGAAMETALTTVASVLSAVADQIKKTGPSDIGSLQTAFTNALNNLAPAVATTVLSPPAQPLPSQLQDLLAAPQPTDELYKLAQQLNLIAKEIKPL